MLTVSWTTPSPAGPWLLTSLVCSFATAPSLSFRFWFHPSAATSAQLAGCSFIALLRHSRVSNVVTVQLPIHVPNVTNKTQRWTGEITDNRATHRSFRYHVSLHFFSADDNLFHFSLSLSPATPIYRRPSFLTTSRTNLPRQIVPVSQRFRRHWFSPPPDLPGR